VRFAETFAQRDQIEKNLLQKDKLQEKGNVSEASENEEVQEE
jgi:hypothetical protein